MAGLSFGDIIALLSGSAVGIFILVLSILAILTPFMIYGIWKNTKTSALILEGVHELLTNIDDNSEAFYKSKNKGNNPPKETAKITDHFINPRDKEKAYALCSCGKRFNYQVVNSGKETSCPGCLKTVTLP